MKKVSRRELAKTAVRQLIAGKDAKQVMAELAAYLLEHKMTNQADMLMSDIATELQAETGHTPATVYAAFALSPDSLRTVTEYVKHATGARDVELTVVEDASLLGGVVIKTPTQEYDASIRRKLNALARGDV